MLQKVLYHISWQNWVLLPSPTLNLMWFENPDHPFLYSSKPPPFPSLELHHQGQRHMRTSRGCRPHWFFLRFYPCPYVCSPINRHCKRPSPLFWFSSFFRTNLRVQGALNIMTSESPRASISSSLCFQAFYATRQSQSTQRDDPDLVRDLWVMVISFHYSVRPLR